MNLTEGTSRRHTEAEDVLRPGDTCWRLERANRLSVIVDAADYFAIAREAMARAERSIFLIGWDFDLRIELTPGRDGDGPSELGAFLRHIVRKNPRLRIWILKWDMAVLYTFQRGGLPFFAHPMASRKRIRLRFDSTHPWTAAHHQKIVVIDDSLAFCGGIDMTTNRWDTRAHSPGDRRRRRPDGEISPPWHDATALVDGAAARALAKLARDRWHQATGEHVPLCDAPREAWPKGLRPHFRGAEVGISRTMPAYDGRPAIHEIERLYIAAIRSARRSIYLESQYFASTRICAEIARRLAEPDGPEVVAINPLTTEGWLERETMGAARDLRLREIMRADQYGRFGMFYPVNAAGVPIYVHAKILIVDDRLIRVGSSNVNNRSMGFDTECDLTLEARTEADRATVSALRDDLLAEHLDAAPQEVRAALAREGSLLGAVRVVARPKGRSLRPIPVRPVSSTEQGLAASHLADPERPAYRENPAVYLAKQATRKVPPSVWLAIGAGAAGLAFHCYRRSRKGTVLGLF